MKIKYVKSDVSLRAFRARDVDELINNAILKSVTDTKPASQKHVFNNWDLPVEPVRYLRCKKYDPL